MDSEPMFDLNFLTELGAEAQPPWGPSGEVVYERTYQRSTPNGTKEQWIDTVQRVARGNMSLVYGDPDSWSGAVEDEYDALVELMHGLKIIPAGRHLWASGVPGRQHLFNCHHSGWGEKFSDHFEFMFMRLMEGGGVGANYSSTNLQKYGPVLRQLNVHITCHPEHPDYDKLVEAGVISTEYSHEWQGAFQVEDSREGWSAGLVDLLDTFFRPGVKHGNRVYNVSRVRKEGAPLRTFGGTASGPLPFALMMQNIAGVLSRRSEPFQADFLSDPLLETTPTPLDAMEIDHEIGQCVVSGGVRRSARMSILPWNDPWVYQFIQCKSDPSQHWTTNISVAVDDSFFAAVAGDPADAGYESGLAHDALSLISSGMLKNGEPGIWNYSLSQQGEISEVSSTNPCGEIALEEWENCNLGHVNMDAFVDSEGQFDEDGCAEAHRLMTRFLIRATYGDVNDDKQAEVLARNRRIGVGHFGVQGWLVKQGVRFSEAPRAHEITRRLRDLSRAVREAAREYAFQLRIPEPVKVTTVAPTGTIAKLAGRSEGIHPVYAKLFIRRMRFSTLSENERAMVEGYRQQGFKVEPDQMAANTVVVEFPTEELLVGELQQLGWSRESALWLVETPEELTLDQMLAFQAMYQEHYADNAVSFTVNFNPENETVESISEALRKWLPHLKGTTLFPDKSRPQAPYERLTEAEWDAILGPKVSADSVDDECATGACPVK